VASMLAAGAFAIVFGEVSYADSQTNAAASTGVPIAPSARVLPPGARDGSGPSVVIYPQRTVPIAFDHASHSARGVSCTTCHPAAKTSRSTSQKIGWSSGSCDKCHGTNHASIGAPLSSVLDSGTPDSSTPDSESSDSSSTSCGVCHEGYKPEDGAMVKRAVLPKPRLHFNHKAHAVRNIGCGQCHGAVQRVGKASELGLPRMRACMSCHGLPDGSRGDAKQGCETCHLTESSGRIRTKYPNGQLRPPRWLGGAEHGADFVNSHRSVAASNSRFCARCHTEDSCAKCHDNRVRPRNVHPNDHLSMHGLAAKQSAQKCNSCHQAESFCKTCHMRSGVTASGPGWSRINRGRVHPPPQVFVSAPVTSKHHSAEARRNLVSCVGCHVERDCTSCHATRGGRGMGVNPHPAGFSSRCRAALSRNARPCLVCHQANDSQLSRCR